MVWKAGGQKIDDFSVGRVKLDFDKSYEGQMDFFEVIADCSPKHCEWTN